MAKATPFKTPKGTINWCIISGDGKENMSGKMKYTADLVLATDSPEAKSLIGFIDDYWSDNKPGKWPKNRPAKSLGYRDEKTPVLDADGNKQYGDDGKVVAEPTGNTVFSFSTDTTYPSGDVKKISVFNAKGNKVDLGDKKIGNGSEGKVSGAIGTYEVTDGKGTITDAGVTLYLNSVQLTKFVPFSGEEQWDADEDEDGWTGEGETDGWEGEEGKEAKSTPRI